IRLAIIVRRKRTCRRARSLEDWGSCSGGVPAPLRHLITLAQQVQRAAKIGGAVGARGERRLRKGETPQRRDRGPACPCRKLGLSSRILDAYTWSHMVAACHEGGWPGGFKLAATEMTDRAVDSAAIAFYSRRGNECAYANLKLMTRVLNTIYDDALRPV